MIDKEIVMKTVKVFMFVTLVLVFGLMSGGCTSPQYQNNQSAWNQGVLGSAIGVGAGLMAANNVKGLGDNRFEAALVGAALGGLLGANSGGQKDVYRNSNQQTQAEIQTLRQEANTFVINVTNSNGSFTPVSVRRIGNQYMGPRGEYYNSMPTEVQLKSYGF
jgi:hypothetical protein